MPVSEDWDKFRALTSARLEVLRRHPCPKQGPIDDKYYNALNAALNNDDPKCLWFIVDQGYEYYGTTMGKLLTVDLKTLTAHGADNLDLIARTLIARGTPDACDAFGWNGGMMMDDSEACARIGAYLKPVLATFKPLMLRKASKHIAKAVIKAAAPHSKR